MKLTSRKAHQCFGILVFVLFIGSISGAAIEVAVAITFDPCTNFTYMNMHNGRRSDEWTKTPQDSICDWREYPSQSWRRFEHDAGVQMSEGLVPFGQCGTQAPIWMNGTHPDEADGIVSRQVCANFGDTDTICNWTAQAQVTYCRDGPNKHYYVYLLPNPIGCMLAYCVDGSTKKNCSEYGQVWNAAELRCVDVQGPSSPAPTSSTPECGSETTAPPIPGEWSSWCEWSNCSKPCDYGIRTRYRICLSLPCSGAGSETEICNAFNCDPPSANDEQEYNGVTVLFASIDQADDTMSLVVSSQDAMLRMFQDDINLQCNANPSSCCGKPLDGVEPIGKVQFVGNNDIFTATGYPRPEKASPQNVEFKYIAVLNADVEASVCGRVSRSAGKTYIIPAILQTAVVNNQPKIESETGLVVKATTLPPTKDPESTGLPTWAIVVIVVVSVLAAGLTIGIVIYVHKRSEKQPNKVQTRSQHTMDEKAEYGGPYEKSDLPRELPPPPPPYANTETKTSSNPSNSSKPQNTYTTSHGSHVDDTRAPTPVKN